MFFGMGFMGFMSFCGVRVFRVRIVPLVALVFAPIRFGEMGGRAMVVGLPFPYFF